MSSDYGYINARIRAMKSFLLKAEDYFLALRQDTLDTFISFLSSLSGYANEMRKIELTQPQELVCDMVLKLNLCRTFKKIIRFSEGEPKKLILIILTFWDIYNLKTIIRGILSAQSKEKIRQALIPAGKWDLEFLNCLLENKDLKGLTNDLLKLPDTEPLELEKEFAQRINNFSLATPLVFLENGLTEVYFKKAREYLESKDNNKKIVLDYLCLKIDFLNITSVFRKQSFDEPVRFMVGGRLSESFLKDLLKTKSIEETLERFRDSLYPWLSEEGRDLYKRSLRISSLESLLRYKLFSFCLNLYTKGDPLSISIPLGFINFKENEITNLRLISKAILYNIPKDLIKNEIIYAQ